MKYALNESCAVVEKHFEIIVCMQVVVQEIVCSEFK